MNISVLQDNLAKALSKVAKFSDAGRTLPVLANILLEADGSRLRLVATNLQMSITMWIGANVGTPGAITLPAKTFLETVNNMSQRDRVDLKLDNATHTVNLKCGTSKSNIKGINADEFPPVIHAEKTDVTIDAKVFRDMINQTVFSAAKEDNRPILTGVYFMIQGNELTMAATDGYRLAVRTGTIEQAFEKKVDMVIPARTLMEIARLISDDDGAVAIALPTERDIVTFHLTNMDISSQILEGRFPDFRAIIPRTHSTEATCYTDDMLRKSKSAEVFSRDNANHGSLKVRAGEKRDQAGEITILGKSQERGDTDGVIDAFVEGKPLDVSFNIRYLIELLNVIGSERVKLQSNGAENPMLMTVEGRTDGQWVLMPMSNR